MHTPRFCGQACSAGTLARVSEFFSMTQLSSASLVSVLDTGLDIASSVEVTDAIPSAKTGWLDPRDPAPAFEVAWSALATEQDFTADKIISEEPAAEEGMMEYTEYVDPKYAEKIMAESLRMADEPAQTQPRKGPASETAEPASEPVTTDVGQA